MNERATKLRDRADRKSLKRDVKKRQIAIDAIEALKHLGYANTSLRDIAANSKLSLGMMHYYFEDKIDLIIFCVRIYKEEFVASMNAAVEASEDEQSIIVSFANGLATSIVKDAEKHRLWYDIRSQAMFDEAFQPVVDEIEAALVNLVKIIAAKLGRTDDIDIMYAALDGTFRYLMMEHCRGKISAHQEISATFKKILSGF